MARFTVDTHLFRELGALLVGRDSTALIELVKNSYDADATVVVVIGEGLSQPGSGYLRVADDGNGMTRDDFEVGFLRIASRLKEQGTRRSPKYKRRYTGAKGIGRLAAHKLARIIQITSWAAKRKNGLQAVIDWDAVEARETLDDVPADAVAVVDIPKQRGNRGTTILLSALRRQWTSTERSRFLAEIQTFSAPSALTQPMPRSVVQRPLIFDKPVVRDSTSLDPGFSVQLQGDLAPSEDYWRVVAEACTWVLEIALGADGFVRVTIAPTRKAAQLGIQSRKRVFRFEPQDHSGPQFQARIYVREGRLPDAVADWAARVAGVRVYLEGFRVLPYGEPRNDWLGLDADYARRSRSLAFDPAVPDEDSDRAAALRVLPNAGYFGGVFLTERSSAPLQMLVNREGFLPDAAYEALISSLRTAISLSVRVRAAAERPSTKRTARASADRRPGASVKKAIGAVHEAREIIVAVASKSTPTKETRAQLSSAVQSLGVALEALEEVAGEASMTRVLASVGTQMGAFVHEVNGLLGATEAMQETIEALVKAKGVDPEDRRRLRSLSASLRGVRRSLERQASYFVEIVSPDARRRRSRLDVASNVEAATNLFRPALERRNIQLRVDVLASLRTPPMFPAELTAIWTNLLSNAIKASGRSGTISIKAESRDRDLVMSVSNTGGRVDIATAERWFVPFESTTTSADPLLGQGMGLGLPITRRLLAEYGGTIEFVEPPAGFATSVEVLLPAA